MIVDTGVLYAAADTDDTDHRRSAQLLTGRSGPLLVPVPVIVETSWLLESRLGPAAELAFLRSIEAGDLTRVDLTSDDWARVGDLVEQYADLGLGLVDASVVVVAERLDVRTIATLNHRDFPGGPSPALPRPGARPLTHHQSAAPGQPRRTASSTMSLAAVGPTSSRSFFTSAGRRG